MCIKYAYITAVESRLTFSKNRVLWLDADDIVSVAFRHTHIHTHTHTLSKAEIPQVFTIDNYRFPCHYSYMFKRKPSQDSGISEALTSFHNW